MENNREKKTDDIIEKLVHINRITKVVKGGRRFGFSALVVVGNQSGKIGIAHAKATKPDSYKGRKPSYTAAQVSLIMQKFKEGDGVNKIARDVGLSKFSVSRITRDPDKALESLSRWS